MYAEPNVDPAARLLASLIITRLFL